MRILVKRGETLVYDGHFSERTIYIGRQEGCQIRLAGDESIMARHLMVFEEAGQWFVEPLHDAYHRSLLSGHLLRERQAIEDRAELTVSDFNISVLPSDRVEDQTLAVQVVTQSTEALQQTADRTVECMGVANATIVKQGTETISLTQGWPEHVASLALKMSAIHDVRALMSMVIDTVFADFDAACVWIGLRTDEQGNLHLASGRDLTGHPVEPPATAQASRTAVAECARAVLYQNTEMFKDHSAMAAPLVSSTGSVGMAYVESRPGRQKFRVPDLDIFMFICTQMAVRLDRILHEQTEQVSAEHAINQRVAKNVQSRVTPWQLPQWPGLNLLVFSEPGQTECTDFYDVVAQGNRHGTVLIGQTDRTETDTALSIAQVCSAFRIGAVHMDAPQVLTRQINWVVYGSMGQPRRISMGILAIDPGSGAFQVCLVGEVHGYAVDQAGKPIKIEMHNDQLVGQARKSSYQAVQGQLQVNQTLVLCTNGIFEMTSPDGQTFREEQLVNLLADNYSQPPATTLKALVDEVSAFTAGQKPNRDVTVFVLRRGSQ